MAVKFLLDTNILSEPLAVKPNQSVLKALEANSSSLATASIVWHELAYGAKRIPNSKRKNKILRYLEKAVLSIPILPYNHEAASWHAKERAYLDSKGETPPYADAQIAAIAAMNNLTLVTRNIKDFRRFRNIAIENWFD